MKIRTFFAVLLCKLARGLLRLLRRGGTAFPGRVALKVYPQVLGVLSQGVRVILVTGTNGKTTSSRMIEQAMRGSITSPTARVRTSSPASRRNLPCTAP